MPLKKGSILHNRYHIDWLLAEGGMGAVYRAYDKTLDITVAIKENFSSSRDKKDIRFEEEAKLLARLKHHALPRVTDHFTINDKQYLVMDFIEGDDLWQMISNQGRPLPERQAVYYIIQICEAVKYLHSQHPPIIHKDIKPPNIKITPDNRAILVDFGLAKVGAEDVKTRTEWRGLTPGYAPPEQYSRKPGSTGKVTDVYSLGATLYTLLTGKSPPDSRNLSDEVVYLRPPRKLNPNLSQNVSRIIMRAMQLEKGKRHQSVDELQRELEKIGRGSIKPVAPPFVISPNQVRDKSSWVLTVIIIALLLTVIGFAGMYYVSLLPTSTPRLPTPIKTKTRNTDGMRMVYVPGGTFKMGSADSDPNAADDEKPQHNVTVDSFWIDKTEVTNAQYKNCVSAGECKQSNWAGDSDFNGNNYPVVGVDWNDARSYCELVGGRLPTEVEWEYTARGKDGRIYPWGNEFDGIKANYLDNGSIDSYVYTAPVGSYPGGASWVGALDMSGNVWEWTQSAYEDYPYNADGREDVKKTGVWVLRGGSWNYYGGSLRAAIRNLGNDYYRASNIGFRCVITVP